MAMFLLGCSSTAKRALKKREAAVAEGVYLVHDSLAKGRVDLAKVYSEKLSTIVAPPKFRATVKPITSTSSNGVAQEAVILPAAFQNKPVVVRDSTEFVKMVEASPILKKQLQEEVKQEIAFQKKTEIVRQETEKVLNDAAETKKSHWFAWTSIIAGGGIITVIVLVMLFPALWPLIQNIFGIIIGFFTRCVSFIGTLFTKKGT